MNDTYNLMQKLITTRNNIKSRARMHGDRVPPVCPDEALRQMAKLQPRKREDFLSIEGLGNTFVENYADEFLKVILENIETPMEKSVAMDSKAKATLKELEKKLVDVNRKNCLLYLTKLPLKRGVDLFGCQAKDPLNILFGSSGLVEVCSVDIDEYYYNSEENESEDTISDKQKELLKENAGKYRKYTALLREINKDIRDKGQNDLYIGYPFVKGRLSGENFDIRCPLALFPVIAERDAATVSLRLDDSRDILYNNTLILAYNKFNKIDKPLPNDVIEDISRNTFIDDLIRFYDENGIGIKKEATELIKFREYTVDTFPKFANGNLVLEPCMVLGKFPIKSSMIQKDFDEILEKGSINELLNILLQNIDDLDYYTDSFSGEEDIKDNDKPLDISEKDLIYINDLNSSQEAVIAGVEKSDSLVVQGPPGTGKSQVITSLIANYVSKEKTVLMVSEKKTALDVVYSRLGNLSTYALLIDDVGNKDAFYSQLSQLIQVGYVSSGPRVNLKDISRDIDDKIKKLESIAEKLYTVDSFGIEPYKLYQVTRRINADSMEEKAELLDIKNKAKASLYSKTFNEVQKIHNRFADADLNESLLTYYKDLKSYPWINDTKESLNDFELISFNQEVGNYKNIYQEWNKKWILPKLLGKGKVKEKIAEIANTYFDIDIDAVEKLLNEDIDSVKSSIDIYVEYQQVKALYNRLNESEKDYFESLLICSDYGRRSLVTTNEELYNNILYDHIVNFEAKNRELFISIKDYDKIIDELKQQISLKKELTKKQLSNILLKAAGILHETKHQGEIRRALESKRRWSVNKFINKFGFELFKSIKIWLLTPEVVSEIIPLEKGIFDLVVFDEASQMYVEKGIPSIVRAKKVVIAGDHKQLRPSKLGSGRTDISEDLPEDVEVTAALEEESLLDLARFKYRDVMLNFHYRSKYEELIAFSNYAFYHGRLYVSPNMETPTEPPIEVHKLDDGVWSDRANIQEARHVVEILKEFFKTRQNDETIGVITFNVSQRDLIDDLIDEECIKDAEFASIIRSELNRTRDGEDIGLFVKNIESVQGDERDVIIFSIGYAKNENGRIVRQWGWLNQKGGENRLNVAISRARQKVYIVTSIYPEELQVEDAKNEGPKYLKKYLQYAFAISNDDKESAQQILLSFGDQSNPGSVISFDSDFEVQVYDALKDKGYNVDTQVGIGGYSIDLAIKKNGNYVLGVECDGRQYHSSKSARERDLHRQKYLESRGWRIHRIWSTNWWKNPNNEINKICKIVDCL